jgi:hypothetical protein
MNEQIWKSISTQSEHTIWVTVNAERNAELKVDDQSAILTRDEVESVIEGLQWALTNMGSAPGLIDQ